MQGYMRGIKQGVRSTKRKKEVITHKLEDGTTLKVPLTKHQDIYVRVKEANKTMCIGQTGAFPVQSQRGHQYIMILCVIDENIIVIAPIKNGTAGEMIGAYQTLMKHLKSAGIKLKK